LALEQLDLFTLVPALTKVLVSRAGIDSLGIIEPVLGLIPTRNEVKSVDLFIQGFCNELHSARRSEIIWPINVQAPAVEQEIDLSLTDIRVPHSRKRDRGVNLKLPKVNL
jgi:hypothetical protein